jgi:lipopolysaccharide export system protein LptA
MAPFRPSSSAHAGPLLAALLALGLTLPPSLRADAAGASKQEGCTEDIDVKADSFDADYKSNTTQLRNVVISQCDIRVEAKRASATGLSFDNTRWTFDGDVRIDVENRGSLRSEQAVVDFQNNQISKATITGSPAEFEQRQSESDLMARGRAGEIVYEVGPGTVRLANDAWIKYGGTEMKGSSLVYDIRQEKVQGASRPGKNERITIRIPSKRSTPAPPPKDDKAQPAPSTPSPRTP